jgi:hypothetical protein
VYKYSPEAKRNEHTLLAAQRALLIAESCTLSAAGRNLSCLLRVYDSQRPRGPSWLLKVRSLTIAESVQLSADKRNPSWPTESCTLSEAERNPCWPTESCPLSAAERNPSWPAEINTLSASRRNPSWPLRAFRRWLPTPLGLLEHPLPKKTPQESSYSIHLGGRKNDSRFGRGVVRRESFFQLMADFGSRPSIFFSGSLRPNPPLMLEGVWESSLPRPEGFPSGQWGITTSSTGRNPFRLMRLLYLINRKGLLPVDEV